MMPFVEVGENWLLIPRCLNSSKSFRCCSVGILNLGCKSCFSNLTTGLTAALVHRPHCCQWDTGHSWVFTVLTLSHAMDPTGRQLKLSKICGTRGTMKRRGEKYRTLLCNLQTWNSRENCLRSITVYYLKGSFLANITGKQEPDWVS